MRFRTLLLLAPAIAGCADHGPIVDLDVRITAASATIVRGTPVELRVVARNVSATPQSIGRECVRPFRVVEESGDEVPLPGMYCLAIAFPPTIIQPGDSTVFVSSWDGSMAAMNGSVVFAPTGDYLLAGRVLTLAEVRSTPITVQLQSESGLTRVGAAPIL